MGQRRMQLSERDRKLLAWCGEQYTVRFDLLGMLMARLSDDEVARARGRVTRQAVSRRVRAWRQAGLAEARTILAGEPLTDYVLGLGGTPLRSFSAAARWLRMR